MSSTTAAAPARFRWNVLLVSGLVIFGIVIVIGIVAPLAMSDPANEMANESNLGLSWGHWFGTDDFGHDMLARTLVATRLTLLMTLAATAISAVSGVLIGTAIWLMPRRIREFGLRVLEMAVSYPGLLVALIITAILGAGATAVVIGIGIAGIPAFARLTANLASVEARRDFVVTARLMGVPPMKVISRHLLPNISEPMLVLTSSGFAVALIDLSGLSFVGLGVQSPDYDYGKLLIDALPAIYTQPTQVMGPAVMIVATILGAMLIGDGLAAAADPRSGAAHRRSRWLQVASGTLRVSSASLADGRPFVEVRNLSVGADSGTELLHGVSLTIAEGEIVGVVGESGSGKSMTAMALAKLLPEGVAATADTLRIGEIDVTGRPDRARLAQALALVYQDPGTTFSPALRMGGQLSEVIRTHGGQSRAVARRNVVKALRTVRITDPELRLGQHPHELSGGMRQRAMIASALVSRPQLIIADEPTTALDVTVQAEILREFKRINRERSTAMLFISHDIGVVQALCDRVLVMKDGEIVERLTGQQLAERTVEHPYTQMLIDATPSINDPVRNAP